MYFVYELIDPQTGETGYVGITNSPNLRYQQHLSGREKNDRKNVWLQQLLAEGIEPKMSILETVDDKKQALERETYWIRRLIRQGVHLTNMRGTPYEEPREPQASIYYTASEAEEILGVDFCLFATLRDKGLITPVISRGTRGGYYLKSDVDELAIKLDKFHRKHGSGLTPEWFRRKR